MARTEQNVVENEQKAEAMEQNRAELCVVTLPLDNLVVAARARAVDLRIARLIGVVAFVLLFDGRNVRLVILFHVTNYVTYIFFSCYFLIKSLAEPTKLRHEV